MTSINRSLEHAQVIFYLVHEAGVEKNDFFKNLSDKDKKTLKKVLDFTESDKINLKLDEVVSLKNAIFKIKKQEHISKAPSSKIEQFIKGIQNIFGRVSSNKIEKVYVDKLLVEGKKIARNRKAGPQELEKARKLLTEATEMGSKEAPYELGKLHERSLTGFTKEGSAAVRELAFVIGAKRGDNRAKSEIVGDVREMSMEKAGLKKIDNGTKLLSKVHFPVRTNYRLEKADGKFEMVKSLPLKDLIKKNNLEPKYKIKVDNKTIYLSDAFGSDYFFTNPDNQKKAYQKNVIAYIPQDGKLVPRLFYLSGNENLWRVAPVSVNDVSTYTMGKGIEKQVRKEEYYLNKGIPELMNSSEQEEPIRSTTNLPFTLQIALHQLSENTASSLYPDPSDTQQLSDLRTLAANIPEELDIKRNLQANSNFLREVKVQEITMNQNPNSQDLPDFSQVERFRIPGIYSDDVVLFRVKSKNQKLEYVFAQATCQVREQKTGAIKWKAKQPTTWLMSVSNIGKGQTITSFGCPAKQMDHNQVVSGVDHIGYHARNYIEVPPGYFAQAPAGYEDKPGARNMSDRFYPCPMKSECERQPLIQDFLRQFPTA